MGKEEAMLDKMRFEIETSRRHVLDMDQQSYLKLLKRERKIVKDPRVMKSSMEKVVEDMRRYSDARGVLGYTFAANADAKTLEASVCGRHEKVVYFCMGRWKNSKFLDLTLGLLSAHTPGSSGGGGYGFNGNRRLYLSKGYVGEARADPEEWIKWASAMAYEAQDGRIDYEEFGKGEFAGAGDLLRIMVEKEKGALEEKYSCVDGGMGI